MYRIGISVAVLGLALATAACGTTSRPARGASSYPMGPSGTPGELPPGVTHNYPAASPATTVVVPAQPGTTVVVPGQPGTAVTPGTAATPGTVVTPDCANGTTSAGGPCQTTNSPTRR